MSDAPRKLEAGSVVAHPAAPQILVVIVNYRTPDQVIACLRSLVPERDGFSQVRVVVTDNASGDDSILRIGDAIERECWGNWVTLRPLERNGGFPFGNNTAIRPALTEEFPPDFIWLLNPDTFVQSRATKSLVHFLMDHPEAGIVGSVLFDPNGSPQGLAPFNENHFLLPAPIYTRAPCPRCHTLPPLLVALSLMALFLVSCVFYSRRQPWPRAHSSELAKNSQPAASDAGKARNQVVSAVK